MTLGGQGWRVRSSSTRRAVRTLTIRLGVTVLALAIVEAVLLLPNPYVPTWALWLFPGAAIVHALAAIAVGLRRPHNAMGSAMMLGAFAWLAAGAANVLDFEALVAIGLIATTTPFLACVYLLLAFPSGRLHDRWDKVLFGVGLFVALALQAPFYVFTPYGPPFDVLQISAHPEWIERALTAQRIVGGATMIGVAVVLFRRSRAATTSQRRVLVPIYVVGILAVLAIPAHSAVDVVIGLTQLQAVLVAVIAMSAVPLAFAACLFMGGFARTAEVDELAAWLGAAEGGRPPVREALAETLGDPTLRLLFWSASTDGYIDATGAPVTGVGRVGRGLVEVESGGRRLGAIDFDATLVHDPALVHEAASVVALALDRDQLYANLRASEEAVRESRRRIVEAVDRERRRLAQDMHDGLQSRLILLSIEADRAGAYELRDGIERAIDDLRALVHGVMPPALVERGLVAATEDLVDRLPLPATLELPEQPIRLDPAVEHAAYLVVSESLTNALKHSGAQRLDVSLTSSDRILRIAIGDDGVGGAAAAGGAGLRGLADRIDGLGGRLTIESRAGAGTLVTAEVPCPV